MDPDKFYRSKRYYSVLGLSGDASPSAIRQAYKKLAMRWHPDKCANHERAEAKIKFQEIQEAYAVLSDENKKLLYDSGLYDPEDDDDDVEGFSSFLNEMSGMMANVGAEEAGKGTTFEELQQLFVSMFSADLAALNNHCQPPTSSMNFDKKRGWEGGLYDATSYLGACMMDQNPPIAQGHYLFTDNFQCSGSSMGMNAAKKNKGTLQGTFSSGGSYQRPCDYGLFKKL